MKRLIFGLLVAGIAFGGSAFTNVKHLNPSKGARSITSAILGQTASGSYSQEDGTGTCTTPTSAFCEYTVVTPNGIPNQATYTQAEINSYVASGWLLAPPTDAPRALYVP